MKTHLTSEPSNGPRLRSALRAGIDIRDLNSFSHALIEEIAINDPHILSGALNTVVEKCKQSGLGAACDLWGDRFGVPFGHG